MDGPVVEQKDNPTIKDWLVPIAIAVLFLVWGLLIFFMVGHKGQPPWDFGVVDDIPGQSPYSTERR
jgi:hypothetical protein